MGDPVATADVEISVTLDEVTIHYRIGHGASNDEAVWYRRDGDGDEFGLYVWHRLEDKRAAMAIFQAWESGRARGRRESEEEFSAEGQR